MILFFILALFSAYKAITNNRKIYDKSIEGNEYYQKDMDFILNTINWSLLCIICVLIFLNYLLNYL